MGTVFAVFIVVIISVLIGYGLGRNSIINQYKEY